MSREHLLCEGPSHLLAHSTVPTTLGDGGVILQLTKLRLREAKGAMARIRTQV